MGKAYSEMTLAEYSWVVASSGPRRGWPTDYEEDQIHPECLRQILQGAGRIIDTEEALRMWLEG